MVGIASGKPEMMVMNSFSLAKPLALLTILLCQYMVLSFPHERNAVSILNGSAVLSSGPGNDASILSKADVNNDGVDELIIQSLLSGFITAYMISENESQIHYIFSDNQLPSNSWVKYLDLDCDQIPEKVAYYDSQHLSIEKGYYQNDVLQFELPEIIEFDFQLSLFDKLDPPFLDDFNNDGKTDMLVLPSGQQFYHLFESDPVFSETACTYESYILSDECWGDFRVNFAGDSVYLNEECSGWLIEDELRIQNSLHFVPGIAMFDYDADNDLDVIIGNNSVGTCSILNNAGDNHFNSVINPLPFLDVGFTIEGNPYPFFYDVDKDGLDDLLVAKQFFTDNEHDFFFHYQNTSTGEFQLNSSNFLSESFFDGGTDLSVKWKDVDLDGMPDLLVTNSGYGAVPSTIQYLKHRGAVFEEFEFEIIDTDFLAVEELDLSNVRLAFGDIDNDNQEDLLITANTASVYFTSDWRAFSNEWIELDLPVVLNSASPEILDIDNDGDQDLLIGEFNGNINLLLNNGSLGLVSFETHSENYGGISTKLDGFPFGQAYLDHYDLNGQKILFVGNSTGQISKYQIDNVNLSDSLIPVETIDLSASYPVFSGFDFYDESETMALGHQDGGFEIFSKPVDEPLALNEINTEAQFSLFPNPLCKAANIKIPSKYYEDESLQLSLFSIQGTLLQQLQITDQNSKIDLSAYSDGLYVLTVNAEKFSHSLRIIKTCNHD